MFSAVPRLLHPQPLEDLGIGLTISAIASALNLLVATILMRAGRRHRSIVLQADSKHLMTDVWTSGGVIVAVLLVGWTGWLRLDPLIAMAVALNIVLTGLRLIGSSAMGLLDAALPDDENALIVEVLRRHQSPTVRFHALQTRESGRQRFVSMHVLVPGAWSVQRGHDLLENVEADIRQVLPDTIVTTHLRENIAGLTVLLEAVVAAGVRRFLFSSSAAVYGVPDVDLITEETPCLPINPYGETKLAGEWLVRATGKAHGISTACLRYFNVAGSAAPELADTGVFNIVPMVFDRLTRGEAPRIFGDDYPTPDGTCIRDYIHVADLADAHLAVARKLARGARAAI